MADTLRSIAVLIAAGIAYYFKGIDPSIADAAASIVVSFIIAISLGPLFAGLLETWREINELKRERLLEMQNETTEHLMCDDNVFLDEFQNFPYGIQ